MSGIAEVMHNLGYQVQGSDIADSYVVEGLRKRGIKVAIGHAPENVEGVAVVVTSTAVKRGNPEVEAALAQRIPIVRRAEMLAELMRLKRSVEHTSELQSLMRISYAVFCLKKIARLMIQVPNTIRIFACMRK